MQTVSTVYLEKMGELIRKPSKMRLTFHYPTGDITYTNEDIVKVSESKTAHLVAGSLPTIDLSVELLNLDGSFNPNDVSGLHDMLIKGVMINYEFGFDVPELGKYGYTDLGEEHDYGMEVGVPYGFIADYATEWVAGGEVFTSGEISYSPTTATITAKDFLSYLEDKVIVTYGTRTLAQIAMDVINLTDYPEDESGDKKIVLGSELSSFSTTIVLSETDDDAIPAKEHLQTIAHAGCVQMYIDRLGYLHLDNDQELTSPAQYYLPLDQQAENPEHRKEQMPKKLTIALNSEYGSPVETELKGGGEAMVVENDFIVTTAEGEALRDRTLDHFIKYRNTAEIAYRGEPALDILDNITLETEFAEDVTAVIVGTDLVFDGTLAGSLTLRYQLGENTPSTVKITGSDNFVYPLGASAPSTASITLTCVTDLPTPTYQWSYYVVSNGAWLDIVGATSDELAVGYEDVYFDNDSSAKFRCVVNTERGAMTQIRKVQLQKSTNSGYRGAVVATTPAEIDVPSAEVGDVVLMDNTSDGTAEVYGEAYVYDGEEWVSTEESDALAMSYKDALQLAKDSGKTIYASEIYADLIVAKRLRVEDGDYVATINATDGIRASYNGDDIFRSYPNGDAEFGKYNPTTKSGGIFYDRANDKLLGNVAYDQWDLVIESDADLALLTTGSTTYTKVLIAPGVYNATAPIDLDAHGVVTFTGADRNNSVLNVDFCISHTGVKGYFLKIGQNTKEMGNFTITSDTTQYDTTVNVNNDIYIIYCPLYGVYPTTNIHDMTIDSVMFAYENTSGTPLPWTRTFGMSGANAGSTASRGQIVGFDGSITNCYFANLWFGIQYFSNISGCKFSSIANSMTECVSITSCIITGSSITQNGISNSWSVTGCTVYDANNRGFSSCFSVAGCRAISSLLTGNGFYLCWEISGCYVAGHQYGFHMCERVSACRCYYSATYDFTYCNYVSSSFSASSPPKWSNCTKVDSDSCNNV